MRKDDAHSGALSAVDSELVKEGAVVAQPGSLRGAFWSRLLGRQMQFAIDILVLSSTFVFSYLLRFEFVLGDDVLQKMLVQLPLVVLVQFACLHLFGIYSFVWRYVGMAEVGSFLRAGWWSLLPLVLLRLGLPEDFSYWQVPLSVILMDTVFAFGGVLGVRVFRRGVYERFEKNRWAKENGANENEATSVLLVGAGRAGMLAAREIQNGGTDMSLRGFVDDDPEKLGAVIQGVKVLGTSREIPKLVREYEIDHVIITIARASRRSIRRVMEICDLVPIRVRIIPGLYEILGGQVQITNIRDVEIEDLLGRDPVQLEEEEIAAFVKDRVVMVTGAGGSIGTEMARQICRYSPSKLLLVERAEFALFDIDRDLRADWPDVDIVPLVADVGDERRICELFKRYSPSVVFHAAAHKHVPMMEANPGEAVKNNVFGTLVTARCAGECGAKAFVLISTDKAVRPTSVMGATKRVAELLVQDLDRQYSTNYVSVRFGNVLDSAGSVVPIFRRQIEMGGPLTVTHPEMVRYFMTIPEASQLVLQAGAMGVGGEIFVLDMGDPVRVLDLAKDMISLSGLKPYEDIDIVFTGIRPGEKLFEEFSTKSEDMSRTKHPKIFIGKIAGVSSETMDTAKDDLHALCFKGDEQQVRGFLGSFLPESRLSG